MSAHPRFRGPIALDGPAASGKTSVGERLAKRLGFAFLDTGLMYRAFTLAALRAGITAADAEACVTLAGHIDLRVETEPAARILLDGEDVTARLHTPDIDAQVSGYSGIQGVRRALIALQRAAGEKGRIVLAGRDIGSVVLPDAPLKLFITASEEARARRRQLEAGSGAREIAARDQKDHKTTPLRPVPGSEVIDTTELGIEEAVEEVMRRIRGRVEGL